jgi:NAD(P)-dependent dehydrogenase (short-subunit alcohol dehydrogenase family)
MFNSSVVMTGSLPDRPEPGKGVPFTVGSACEGGGMRLERKVALITGGASGMGKVAATLFAAEGARVVVTDVADDIGEDVAASIVAGGGEAAFVHADVSQESDAKTMIEATIERFGSLDVLYNNAGIMPAEDGSVDTTEDAVWDRVLAINVKGVAFGCKYGVPAMIASGGGSIINVASFVAWMGAATPQIAYTSSKGAVLAMTREIAIIHARENIRANALSPGPVRTALLEKFLSTEERRQRRLVHIPMGRFGEAREIAQAALFLASDESSFITGADFRVDGGITAAYVTPEGSSRRP